MPCISIGTVARLANVNVQTLRYYERKGVLPAPSRRNSGYREYPAETIGLIKVIKRFQGMGFSLREVKELLALRKKQSTTFGDVSARIQAKIEEVDARINDLLLARGRLAEVLERHRQAGARLLNPAFEQHLEELAREALSQDNDRPRRRPRPPAPGNGKPGR
jgi:DNA-binding transcriptional MerR regulator